MEISKVKVNIKLKSFPILFDEILLSLVNNASYAHKNFKRIGTGSESEIFQLPNDNVLRLSQDPCSKVVNKFFMSKKCSNYPQVFNYRHIRNKFKQDIYVSEMEMLVKLDEDDKLLIKPIETYFRQLWSKNAKTAQIPKLSKKAKELFDSCMCVYTEFKDSKFKNDMFVRNFMKRPSSGSYVIVDPICLKSFIRI